MQMSPTGDTTTHGIQNHYDVKKSKNALFHYKESLTFSPSAGNVIQEPMNGTVRNDIEGSEQLSSQITRSSSQPARRPLHALEPLVESGVRIAVRLRPHQDCRWRSLCLAGMTVRKNLLGVASIVRVLGLEPAFSDRLWNFLHSSALDLN
jgi:hypothetical protein